MVRVTCECSQRAHWCESVTVCDSTPVRFGTHKNQRAPAAYIAIVDIDQGSAPTLVSALPVQDRNDDCAFVRSSVLGDGDNELYD